MKKIMSYLTLALLILSLVACSTSTISSSRSSSASSKTGSSTTSQTTVTTATKLAVGTLKLEGTSLAVSAKQAKDLLPLWKAVKSLGSNSTTSQKEIEALYQQIRETMSTEQVSEIDKLSLDTSNLQSTIAGLGIDTTQASTSTRTNQASSGSSSSSRSGQSSSSRSGSQGGFQGGPPPGEIGPGGMPGGGFGGAQQQSTPVVSRSTTSVTTTQLYDALIKLLAARAG